MLSRIYLRGTVNVTQNKGLKQTHWTWRPGSNLGPIKRRVNCTWVIVDVIEPANKMCRTSADWARLQETVTTQLLSECRTPVDLKVAGGSFPGESHLFEYFCILISDIWLNWTFSRRGCVERALGWPRLIRNVVLCRMLQLRVCLRTYHVFPLLTWLPEGIWSQAAYRSVCMRSVTDDLLWHLHWP